MQVPNFLLLLFLFKLSKVNESLTGNWFHKLMLTDEAQ
jgi:hypothetical protein